MAILSCLECVPLSIPGQVSALPSFLCTGDRRMSGVTAAPKKRPNVPGFQAEVHGAAHSWPQEARGDVVQDEVGRTHSPHIADWVVLHA